MVGHTKNIKTSILEKFTQQGKNAGIDEQNTIFRNYNLKIDR